MGQVAPNAAAVEIVPTATPARTTTAPGGSTASKRAPSGDGGLPVADPFRSDLVGFQVARGTRLIARPSRFYDSEFVVDNEALAAKSTATPASLRRGRNAVRVESATAVLTASAIAKTGLSPAAAVGAGSASASPAAAVTPAPVESQWTGYLTLQYQRQLLGMALPVAVSDWRQVPWNGPAVNDLDASVHFPVCAVCLTGGRLVACDT